ncbi:TrpB-like pyridoxal phosphate-dependent enzyme [Candidatus Bathyarchaeota archaeon]|nr:TrpB-like pyridoxal phosphate-dependent enzyme [Candidatus Bathyarchaeota archaeon]
MDRTLLLREDQIPKFWYNVVPDLPKNLEPLLDPATREPVKPEALSAIFCKEILRQEVTRERFVPIPDEVREAYRLWRPTPMFRARRLEKALKTPAKIYYKYEGVSPPGSHKPNTAVPQAYYNAREGVGRLTTETGAGQWGSSLAFAGMLFDLDVTVYMVRTSYDNKPYRKVMMGLYGAVVYPSPSTRTDAGKAILAKDPNCPGSLGIAISEAVEDCVKSSNTKYSLGSVLNHVLMHQTVTGQEAQEQMRMAEDYPDMVIGCAGGGSNFGGVANPFYHDRVTGKALKETRFIAVESAAAPSLTMGEYLYDHGDTGRMTPLIKMYTLGHDFVPSPVHAGGLRYHGKAPITSLMVREKVVEARACNQIEAMEAATTFLRAEGLIPAPESAHSLKAVIDEAVHCRETGEEKTILTLLSGHGYFDMKAYESYLAGELEPYALTMEEAARSVGDLRRLYPWA